MRRRQNISKAKHWFRVRVLPVLVLAALAGAGYLAANVRVPTPVPDFALQAAAVYRLEVGAACFAVFYLAAWAFALALDITERYLGPREQQRLSGLSDKRLP
jgi:hypothetical protein